MTDQISAAIPILHAPPPRAPPSLSSTSSYRPIYLPVYSTSQTMEALKHAYDKMDRPTTLILLHHNTDQFWKVKDTLTHEGLSVVNYNDPGDAQNCKTFFGNQVGVLITTRGLFSGMEAANVIWVTSGKASYLVRSNKLRTIKKLCVVNNSAIDNWNGFKVDGKFARCHGSYEESLFQCWSQRQIVLAHSCAAVCHQSCKVEFLTRCRNILYFFICMLFPYYPCFCPASDASYKEFHWWAEYHCHGFMWLSVSYLLYLS